MFSKIKGFFGKASMESLDDLEKNLKELENKLKNGYIAIIGFNGKVKGLPLLYDKKNDIEVKKIAARIVDSISSLNRINQEQSVENFIVHYTLKILYFRKITSEVALIGYLDYGDDINTLKDWVKENLSEVISIFQ